MRLAMRPAMRLACGTQYTDRQTNIQTDQQLTHLSDKRSRSVTCVRVSRFIELVGETRMLRISLGGAA
jgi:hypothetical protein